MRMALELARRPSHPPYPNPWVGCVIVKNRNVVGRGRHRGPGSNHAEVAALHQADARAKGATLYVTLEPCCHFGRTPPCTDALIRAGIANVVPALEGPFPQVAGQGAARLRGAGIRIEVGVCPNEARRQNAPYFKLLTTGRPHVHAT